MKTTVFVKLEIEGEPADAFEVVDRVLDGGAFQDEINCHDVDGCGSLHVKAAISGGLSHLSTWLRDQVD
jgi:hypothetical protein